MLVFFKTQQQHNQHTNKIWINSKLIGSFYVFVSVLEYVRRYDSKNTKRGKT